MSDSPEKEKETVRSLLSDLKQLRDEMSVQMHLAGSELKEQWDKLDDQYHKLSHD